jgi:hypothetical protein
MCNNPAMGWAAPDMNAVLCGKLKKTIKRSVTQKASMPPQHAT